MEDSYLVGARESNAFDCGLMTRVYCCIDGCQCDLGGRSRGFGCP